MPTSIELSGSTIRLCRESRGKLVALESFPVPADVPPLTALATAPLPRPLGRVNLVLHHEDMLLRTMLQPPCPPDRLGRIVRFELQGMSREEADPVATCWHVVKGMGSSGDMRVLAQLTKRRLLDQVAHALNGHGGKLGSLVHPAIALFRAYQRQAAGDREPGLVVDIGATHLHFALVADGELLFLRTVTPGLSELVKQVAELRGLPEADAAALMARLGKSCPADLSEVIRRQAQAVAGTLNTNLRFAKAQLQLDKFEPRTVWLAGAAAQVYGFADALRERMQCRLRLLNPFAGVIANLPAATLDQQSALPSPWTACIGAAFAENLELDALSESREQRAQYWRTDGALRAAAAVGVVLVGLAATMQTVSITASRAARDDLASSDDKTGLVPEAEAMLNRIDKAKAELASTAAKAAFLDGERRPGRIAVELFAAIADQQDPATSPVVLQRYDVSRATGCTRVEIEGIADTAQNRSTSDVLRTFLAKLVQHYEPITGIEEMTKAVASGRQEWHYALYLADRPAEVLNKSTAGKTLTIKVATSESIDARFTALAMVYRHRTTEDDAVVTVVDLANSNVVLGKYTWGVTKPLERVAK